MARVSRIFPVDAPRLGSYGQKAAHDDGRYRKTRKYKPSPHSPIGKRESERNE